MLDYIKDYVKINYKSIIFLLVCITVGLVVGNITFGFMPSTTKTELTTTLKETLDYSKSENFQGINVIKNGMISNFILVLIIYFSAITLISSGLIFFINFFKGFAIGLYIPTLFQVFGFGNGIMTLFLLVIIPNIVYIPAFIYLSISSIDFHYSLIDSGSSVGKISLVFKEVYKVILGFSIIALSVILEQLLCMGAIKIYMNM